MTTKKVSFDQFLEYFPIIELPINITDENFDEMRRVNKDLPLSLIENFITIFDQDVDEFTEYFPCFQLPNTGEFVSVVYWKAKLMQYEFHLINYSLKGEFIAGKVIAQTLSNGNTIIRSLASIDEDWVVQVVSGEVDVEDEEAYEAKKSKAHTLEILSTGDIIFSLNEELYE